jgi:hypothetical protein
MVMNPKTPAHAPTSQPFLGAFDLFKPSINGIILNIKTFLFLIFAPVLPLAIAVPFFILSASIDIRAVEIAGFVLCIILLVASVVLMLLTAPGLYVTHLASVRGQVVEPMAAFREGRKHFWRFIGASILQALIFIVAFIALIIPLFFMMRRYTLVQYYVIDKNMGVMDALSASAADSLTFKSPMWGLVGVLTLLNVAGGFPIIQYVAWIPGLLYSLAPAVRYQEIQTASKAAEASSDISSVLGKPAVS